MTSDKPQPKSYEEIDWRALRANALAEKGWKSKSAEDWDRKARSFAKRNKGHGYVSLFMDHLPLQPEMTVLDVGSGPGTLSLPIAKEVSSVTALDFSAEMLKALDELAQEQGITNVTTIKGAWEDDWHNLAVAPHDIAIASRSMAVEDLEAAVTQLNSFATRYVFISDRIGDTPMETGAFAALGRPVRRGPDYIYTLNTLYSLGIHANVSVLTLDRDLTYQSMEHAVEGYSWMFPDITEEETEKLQHYIRANVVHQSGTSLTVRRQSVPRWALIWWQKPPE